MTKTFKHILIPYNGTARSQKTFRKAISLASALQAQVTIFTCLEKRITFALFKTKTRKEELEKEKKLVEKQHLDMKEFARRHDVKCDSKIVRGDSASNEILSFIEHHDIDLIIMSKTKFVSHYEKMHHYNTIENVFSNTSRAILILN